MHDAIQVYEKIGLTGDSLIEDMNDNGIVDFVDLFFVTYGYGQVSTESGDKKPVFNVDGKTLNSILSDSQKEGIFVFSHGDKTFTAGNPVKIDLGIGELGQPSIEEFKVRVGQYDKDNRLIQVEEHIIYKGFETAYGSIEITPLDNAETIKVFTWDTNELSVWNKSLTMTKTK